MQAFDATRRRARSLLGSAAMSSPRDSFDPRRFRSTVPFYTRYRLGYPEVLLARVAAFAGLRPGDAVMDLGCGPGLLAVPLARMGFRVTAIDPEPEMLAACATAADAAGVALDLRQGSSFDLPAGIGSFRLVTMGRAFHWMDRVATLAVLDSLVTADGAVALFHDEHPKTAENAWRILLREMGGRSKAPHRLEAARPDFRSHEALLMDSAFPRLSGMSEFVRRAITVDEVVGLASSLSSTAPEALGEDAGAFEAALRERLHELSPDGRFTEIAELAALVARRAVP
jgi:SAM-dependent methyltransferase